MDLPALPLADIDHAAGVGKGTDQALVFHLLVSPLHRHRIDAQLGGQAAPRGYAVSLTQIAGSHRLLDKGDDLQINRRLVVENQPIKQPIHPITSIYKLSVLYD